MGTHAPQMTNPLHAIPIVFHAPSVARGLSLPFPARPLGAHGKREGKAKRTGLFGHLHSAFIFAGDREAACVSRIFHCFKFQIRNSNFSSSASPRREISRYLIANFSASISRSLFPSSLSNSHLVHSLGVCS